MQGNSRIPILIPKSLLVGLLAGPLFFCGCTSVLWDSATFARQHRPATPADVRLFYSKERQDILVRYAESREGQTNSQPRCYWLEPNTIRVNREHKPHFVSPNATNGLTPVPVLAVAPAQTAAPSEQLYAVAGEGDGFFTLYSGNEKMDPYKLPSYPCASQKVKQVLLTPFAVAVDLTIVGAIASYYAGPGLFASLAR